MSRIRIHLPVLRFTAGWLRQIQGTVLEHVPRVGAYMMMIIMMLMMQLWFIAHVSECHVVALRYSCQLQDRLEMCGMRSEGGRIPRCRVRVRVGKGEPACTSRIM